MTEISQKCHRRTAAFHWCPLEWRAHLCSLPQHSNLLSMRKRLGFKQKLSVFPQTAACALERPGKAACHTHTHTHTHEGSLFVLEQSVKVNTTHEVGSPRKEEKGTWVRCPLVYKHYFTRNITLQVNIIQDYFTMNLSHFNLPLGKSL